MSLRENVSSVEFWGPFRCLSDGSNYIVGSQTHTQIYKEILMTPKVSFKLILKLLLLLLSFLHVSSFDRAEYFDKCYVDIASYSISFSSPYFFPSYN